MKKILIGAGFVVGSVVAFATAVAWSVWSRYCRDDGSNLFDDDEWDDWTYIDEAAE